MMSNRPPDPKNARNKNVLVVGGSGSGKTRFWLKPNLLQCHSSYVVTDPKGSIVVECGNALLKNGYKLKILNTINFKKSMHYNPFAYVHSEKDILKLVTTLMTNTKGEGSGGDPFWEKSERLLLTALIAYLHYEAPVEEQNFATLLEMLNTMQVLEDDEEYQNPVDLLFEELAKKKPNSFAGRQYKLYKRAAGVTSVSYTHLDVYKRQPTLPMKWRAPSTPTSCPRSITRSSVLWASRWASAVMTAGVPMSTRSIFLM